MILKSCSCEIADLIARFLRNQFTMEGVYLSADGPGMIFKDILVLLVLSFYVVVLSLTVTEESRSPSLCSFALFSNGRCVLAAAQ